jgi:hypothetical protein
MKSVLKGARFCDASDIIKNATEELKRFSQMASRNVCERSQSLADVYIARGDCFEETVLYFSEMK